MDLLKQKMESDLQSLKETLDTLNVSVSNLSVCLQEHKEQTTAELAHLQTSLSSTQSSLTHQSGQLNTLDDLPSKLDTLNTSFSQHQQQTTADLAHLQASFKTTQSYLANQTGQLSKLDDLSSKLDNLNTSFSQHQQQTRDELTHLQTSLNSTHSSHNTELNRKLDDLYSKMCGLYSEVGTLSFKLDTQEKSLSQHQQQTIAELTRLQTSLNSTQYSNNTQINKEMDSISTELCFKLDTLNTSLTQHQQQTTAELAHLQNSFNSKLDSLMATAAHLSSDHQEIQTSISDVQCIGTQQGLQDNLTHQLEMTKENVTLTPKEYSCGGTGGWRRVVHLDMTDPHTTCPSGRNMTGYSKRTCGRYTAGFRFCSSATFPVSGGEYSRVCGRIKAYQWGPTTAFRNYHTSRVTTIDGAYAGGVSLTHGTPRNHIWTFVAGLSESNPSWSYVCPCDANSTIHIPPFVGNDYFCESGINKPWDINTDATLHSNDILWDGEDCLPSSTCCSQHNPPYFTKQLPTPTTNDIETRICLRNQYPRGNIAVELVELYVQ